MAGRRDASARVRARRRFARHDSGHLFVTGRAGTGKSTLLRTLRDHITDEAIVLAPTGLAAVNVGGQTIHSFFGFPPRLIGRDDIKRSRNGRLMRKLKLIIIDEVSMVRSDLMWAIDQSLRVNRGARARPSAASASCCSATFHQLPPVIQGDVVQHLEDEHGGPFFFQVPALDEGAGVSLLELDRVFRQSDPTFLTYSTASATAM
ncbi:MAG: AAA family ATPase [Hyphomicrobium sp.]